METLLRMRDVEVRIGFTAAQINNFIREGKFPPPVKIATSARWPESRVQQWITEQINKGVTS